MVRESYLLAREGSGQGSMRDYIRDYMLGLGVRESYLLAREGSGSSVPVLRRLLLDLVLVVLTLFKRINNGLPFAGVKLRLMLRSSSLSLVMMLSWRRGELGVSRARCRCW